MVFRQRRTRRPVALYFRGMRTFDIPEFYRSPVIGKVKAERVQLAQHADFSGDLCCAGIAVDEGAKIQASFSRDQIQNG